MEFDEFYAVYHPYVRRQASSTGLREPDDVAQEVMLQAFEHFEAFRDELDPRPWFDRIVHTLGRDRRQRPVPMDLRASSPIGPEASSVAGWRFDMELLRTALGCLGVEERELVVRHDLQGVGIAELAAEAGMSVRALRKRLERARRGLALQYLYLGGHLG